MTGANVFDVMTGDVSQAFNANAAVSRDKADSASVSGLFATMLSSGIPTVGSAADTPGVSVGAGSSSEEAYKRYQYLEIDLEESYTPEIAEKLIGKEGRLDEFDEQIYAAISEDLGVTEDEVLEAMEVLGLTAVDLIEQPNLIELAMELTGVEEASELLTNSDFVDLMRDVEALGNQLMTDLDIPLDQAEDFVMCVVTEFKPFVEEGADELDFSDFDPNELTPEDFEDYDPAAEEPLWLEAEDDEVNVEPESEATVVVQASQEQGTVQVPAENEEAEETELPEEPVEAQGQTAAQAQTVPAEAEEMGQDEEEQTEDHQPKQSRGPQLGEPMTGAQVEAQDFRTMPIETAPVDDSYLSIDTMDIIRQIAEKVRVTLSENATSMELQLNPENLGKVYLQVTAKEGSVSAQIAAANEAVKNALEMQIIDLKESLNQAGVKVDAIEVTVASHEFEQNLEQDARREEQEGEQAETVTAHRRSLRMDSLDELAGLMTEEEALVARIMRENGNTMDLTV